MRTLTNEAERAAMVPVQVVMVLNVLGHDNARIAGGAVRDSLLGVEPKDWDVATSTRPEFVVELAEWQKWPVRFNENSLAHGTVTLHVDGMDVEVTTLRTDDVTDGRHAEVSFTESWVEDSARRDLTFNAMFMDADGTVYDHHGGMTDLLEGRVRFVGNASERLQEDFLRILRFFRFAGRMGCSHLDPCALRAIGRHSNSLRKISGERVWMEMSKILTGPLAGEMMANMENHNVLSALGMSKPDVDAAFAASCMGGRAETVLAALVDNHRELQEVASQFKLSNDERKVAEHVSQASTFVPRRHPRNWTDEEWMKHAVLHGRDMTLELLCLTNRLGFRNDVMAHAEVPVFPLSGNHLMTAGVKPGPEMGRKLKVAKQAWMDSGFKLDVRKLVQLAVAA